MREKNHRKADWKQKKMDGQSQRDAVIESDVASSAPAAAPADGAVGQADDPWQSSK